MTAPLVAQALSKRFSCTYPTLPRPQESNLMNVHYSNCSMARTSLPSSPNRRKSIEMGPCRTMGEHGAAVPSTHDHKTESRGHSRTFFLTCELKYTLQQKCPLLYSKVKKVSFCCTFLLLSRPFHKISTEIIKKIFSQQEIVKMFL